MMGLFFTIETEEEADGRWIAEVMEIPGALVYGSTSEDAVAKVQALALRVVAERLECGEESPELISVSFKAA
ncbi:MAG: type II toxin-antitoxin system HicB family antitoxin [Chloroflexi bacterium]|nr:type II toxin-antitoxin system HicB family antitoxin [Chloroflexota bacterium]MYE39929.1 type II toxin-antitoxin system HicB family antitoxin [Chloroflexota bacterium]